MSDMQRWLSPEEAAKYLSIGRTKLYDLAKTGKIPAEKIDKQWRFKTSDLDTWLSTEKSIEGFFRSVTANIEDNDQLRTPQKEAYAKLRDYFEAGGKKALVQLPVGCGKSGLAAIAPFGISEGRVLVVTPNLTIKTEMKNNLDINSPKCFWRRAGVLSKVDMVSGPYVATLDTGNTSVTDKSHFVVTNVHQLATDPEKWLKKFPHDYFDMIIIDEAHHNAADSWGKTLEHFPDAKIINLTATPFRSDSKEVVGEKIYRYPFRSAVANGYLKRLTAVYVTPQEVELTFKGETEKKKLTLEEVVKLKDKDWFSRGIAMSDECNQSIVNNSIEKLEWLRDDSSIKHQIIAVAMSIPHAEKIKLLYEQRGYETEVIHSKMKDDEKERIFKRLKGNELDVVVNVAMLGEGFDHPPLGVAAIFRPFRNLSPYLQFVGRIMRVNVQNMPRHKDNYGFIVTHIGMNLDSLAEDFKLFEKDDEEFWAQINGGMEQEEPLQRGTGGGHRIVQAPLFVHSETVDSLYQEDFVDDDADAVAQMKDYLEAIGVDGSKAAEILQKVKLVDTGVTPAAAPIPVQPQQELERLRKQLVIEVKAQAKTVVANTGLNVAGNDIPMRLMKEVRAANNLVAAIVIMNSELKKLIADKSRDDWSAEDYKKAIAALPTVATQTIRRIHAAKGVKNAKG